LGGENFLNPLCGGAQNAGGWDLRRKGKTALQTKNKDRSGLEARMTLHKQGGKRGGKVGATNGKLDGDWNQTNKKLGPKGDAPDCETKLHLVQRGKGKQ